MGQRGCQRGYTGHSTAEQQAHREWINIHSFPGTSQDGALEQAICEKGLLDKILIEEKSLYFLADSCLFQPFRNIVFLSFLSSLTFSFPTPVVGSPSTHQLCPLAL